jgi:hypothetical protein
MLGFSPISSNPISSITSTVIFIIVPLFNNINSIFDLTIIIVIPVKKGLYITDTNDDTFIQPNVEYSFVKGNP